MVGARPVECPAAVPPRRAVNVRAAHGADMLVLREPFRSSNGAVDRWPPADDESWIVDVENRWTEAFFSVEVAVRVHACIGHAWRQAIPPRSAARVEIVVPGGEGQAEPRSPEVTMWYADRGGQWWARSADGAVVRRQGSPYPLAEDGEITRR